MRNCSCSAGQVSSLAWRTCEITMRSPHIALGYLDPADERGGSAPRNDASDRAYRTGDLGRFGPDGTVMLAGPRRCAGQDPRIRVEPAEVAAMLRADPAVRDAVVVAADDARGERQLLGTLSRMRPG